MESHLLCSSHPLILFPSSLIIFASTLISAHKAIALLSLFIYHVIKLKGYKQDTIHSTTYQPQCIVVLVLAFPSTYSPLEVLYF
jgi:hypothetical protein